jgi:hypothetical protein
VITFSILTIFSHFTLYTLCNKNQAVEIFQVSKRRWCRRTVGDVIRIVRFPLVFVRVWLFSKFHLPQLRLPDVYYAKTPVSLLIWRKRELILMTLPNRRPMSSTAEQKWSLYLQTFLVFTSSPGGRVWYQYSYKEHVLGSSPNVGMHFLNFILFIFCACWARKNNTRWNCACILLKYIFQNFCV